MGRTWRDLRSPQSIDDLNEGACVMRGYKLLSVLCLIGSTFFAHGALAITCKPAPAPYALVANSSSNTVSLISTLTNQVTSTINVGQSPVGVALSRNGGFPLF